MRSEIKICYVRSLIAKIQRRAFHGKEIKSRVKHFIENHKRFAIAEIKNEVMTENSVSCATVTLSNTWSQSKLRIYT